MGIKSFLCKECKERLWYFRDKDKEKKFREHKKVCSPTCRFCEGEGCSMCGLSGHKKKTR